MRDNVDHPAIVYLSGRMAGEGDHGANAFSVARQALRARGYSVLCPSEATSVHQDYSRQQHLRRDISMVLIADEVCVLAGWEMSKGACIEVMIAIAVGIPVWEYETGQRIDTLIAEQMDPRRFVMPIDFMAWHEQTQGDDEDQPEGEPVEVPVVLCGDLIVPFRGASMMSCELLKGHIGKHECGETSW